MLMNVYSTALQSLHVSDQSAEIWTCTSPEELNNILVDVDELAYVVQF